MTTTGVTAPEMLTDDGLKLVADAIFPALASAVVVVGDGSQFFQRELDEGFPQVSADGRSLVFQATFGPEEANGEWAGEGLRVGERLIEWEERDAGRKPLGSVWTVQVTLDLAAPESD